MSREPPGRRERRGPQQSGSVKLRCRAATEQRALRPAKASTCTAQATLRLGDRRCRPRRSSACRRKTCVVVVGAACRSLPAPGPGSCAASRACPMSAKPPARCRRSPKPAAASPRGCAASLHPSAAVRAVLSYHCWRRVTQPLCSAQAQGAQRADAPGAPCRALVRSAPPRALRHSVARPFLSTCAPAEPGAGAVSADVPIQSSYQTAQLARRPSSPALPRAPVPSKRLHGSGTACVEAGDGCLAGRSFKLT